MFVCLSVVSYTQSHLWVDPDETLHGDSEGLITDIGDRMWNHPYRAPGASLRFGIQNLHRAFKPRPARS